MQHRCVWLAAILVLVWPSLACGQWKVGLDRENITPKQSMWMAGYAARTRPADGQIHELWAKALILEDETGGRTLLLTLDLLGIDRQFSDRVLNRLNSELGWEPAQVALCCSHTHSGPVVGTNLISMYPLDGQQQRWVAQYTAELEDKLVALAARTATDLQPASIGWTRGHCGFAVNRRNNPEPQVRELRTQDQLTGPTDHDVPLLVIRNKQEEICVLVFGYACHATVLSDLQWCGDWPGFAQLEIEQRIPGCQAMFVAGCGGDQNPLPRRTVKLAAQYGSQMADSIQTALNSPIYPIHGPLAVLKNDIALPYSDVPSIEKLKAVIAAAESETAENEKPNRYEVARAIQLLEKYEQEKQLAVAYPYPVQTWQLGSGPTWVFLSGEVVVDYSLRLKQELGRETTWVSAYANDVMAYIPSERVLQEGGYEGGGAMVYYGLPSPWQAGLEAAICQEVCRQERVVKTERNNRAESQIVKSNYNHQRLLYYIDADGVEQEIHSAADWEKRRLAILDGMQQMMGPLPDRSVLCPLDVQELARESFDSYERKTLSYAAEPGSRVSAHLYLPKTLHKVEKSPAILALHQTSARGKLDVGVDGKPDRTYAHELAMRGYIVLAPDYPSFGDQSDYDFLADRYVSGTMKGIFNHQRAIDLLVERADVDPERLGVIGHSLGGHNALFVAAFDSRLKVVVSSCGWTPFHHYYGGQKLVNWAQDRYMPRMNTVFQNDPDQVPFDFYEVVAALAPRTFYSCSPLHDENFEVAGVEKVEAAARKVYALFNAEQELIVRYPDTGHTFPTANREEAYQIFDRVLR